MQNPNDAVRIVKEFQSKEGAKLVARYTFIYSFHIYNILCRYDHIDSFRNLEIFH